MPFCRGGGIARERNEVLVVQELRCTIAQNDACPASIVVALLPYDWAFSANNPCW
jgi:hypothetical protein